MTMTTERPLVRMITEQKGAEVETDAASLCKTYLLTNEDKKVAERALESLKPQIEEVRASIGPNTPNHKETVIPGKFRGVKGHFKINPVVSNKRTISLEVLQENLSPAIFEKYIVPHIKEAEVTFNLISFAKG